MVIYNFCFKYSSANYSDRDESISTAVDDLTLQEMEHALQTLSNCKSPGVDNANSELIRYSGIMYKLRIIHFLNVCWESTVTPQE